jgi:hypothetical protein
MSLPIPFCWKLSISIETIHWEWWVPYNKSSALDLFDFKTWYHSTPLAALAQIVLFLKFVKLWNFTFL